MNHDDNSIPVYQVDADSHTLKPVMETYFSNFHGERPDDSKFDIPTFCPHHSTQRVMSEVEQAFRRALFTKF